MFSPFYDQEGKFVAERDVEFPFFDFTGDVIPRFLNTVDSLENLTFTAGCGAFAKEQWHGRIFRESPLFTIDRVRTPEDKVVNLGDNWMILDETGQELLCMITGIALDDETSLVNVFVRHYELSKQQSRGVLEVILTEAEEVILFDDLDFRLLRVVSVQHFPSVRPVPGFLFFSFMCNMFPLFR